MYDLNKIRRVDLSQQVVEGQGMGKGYALEVGIRNFKIMHEPTDHRHQ